METIKLICLNCNGALDVDKNREILMCPYCGVKSLLVESDEVKIVRSNNLTKEALSHDETKRTIHHDSTLRDIEIDKNNTELELKKLSLKEKQSTNELIATILSLVFALALFFGLLFFTS